MAYSSFRRPRHQRIARVLDKLDAALLGDHRCYFGGGTVIALLHGEYRESNDLDFLVSDWASYRALRQRVTADGLQALGNALHVAREARADRYGIRGAFIEGETPIKFEIVHEGRIDLTKPAADEQLCGISTLSGVDQYSTKYLANDDRWADRAVHSRDIVDIAMMNGPPSVRDTGRRKAADAYGDSVIRTQHDAANLLLDNPDYRARCIAALQMDPSDEAELTGRLRSLPA